MARKRPAAPPAWTRSKISATILEFGAPLIEQLPAGAPLELRRALLEIVVQVWNAHAMAMPVWAMPQFLVQTRETFERACAEGRLAPQALEAFELLSQRRREPRFADDPRAVGDWSVRMIDDEHWNLRCDARLPTQLDPRSQGVPPPPHA